MSATLTFRWLVLLCLASPALVRGDTSDPLLFRLFLNDGTSLVSYGEFTRLDDRVIFSLVAGGGVEPRLQVATLPASTIDWERTDRHAASTRYQWYANTRGEADFLRLSNDVADVLNQVVQTNDRGRALDVAQRAWATLAEWPREHFGYRQRDVREVLAFLDEVIANLRAATGAASFDLAMVASAPDIELEPLATMPSPRDQVDQVLRIAALTTRPTERVALLRTALELLRDSDATISPPDADVLRRVARSRLLVEEDIDGRYTDLSRRLMRDAAKGAARAKVSDVQQVLNRIPREDARLGHRRPETVQALRASVQAQLDAARRLRLLRDRWTIRRSHYRDYERSIRVQLAELERSKVALEAIKRLEGPTPDALVRLRARFRGGAEHLERLRAPGDFRRTHDLLIGAWRFAETAIDGRWTAARGGNIASAWRASSAAGSALLLLTRVQGEIRELLEPPRLQ